VIRLRKRLAESVVNESLSCGTWSVLLFGPLGVAFHAISGNGKQLECGGSGKVSGKNLAKRLVVQMARNDRKKRAKAFFFDRREAPVEL